MSVILNGSSQYLILPEQPKADFPGTITAWVKHASLDATAQTVTHVAEGTGSTIADVNGDGLIASNVFSTPDYALRAAAKLSGLATFNLSGDPSGTWTLAAFVFEASNSRKAGGFRSGDSTSFTFGTNTTGLATHNFADSSLMLVGVKATAASTLSNYLNGRIAHLALWDDILTEAEVAELGTYAPNHGSISYRANLLRYWPLNGDANAATSSYATLDTTGLTGVGTPTYDTGDNPSITLESGASVAPLAMWAHAMGNLTRG